MRLTFSSLSTLGFALLLAACGSPDPRYDRETVYLGAQTRPPQPERSSFDNVSYWDGDHVSGSPKVVVNLTEQRAFFYKGGELVGVSMISTGREGFGTIDGAFKVIQKSPNHRSNLYGDFVDANGNVVVKDVDTRKDKPPAGTKYLGASMPYFMRVKGGTGLHAGFLPGYPASHGCIRMPEFMARNFFNNVELGTPVSIVH